MVVTRTNGTPSIGPAPSIPDVSGPTMTSTSVVSAEHAVEWPIAGVVWHADLHVLRYTSDHALRLDARFLRFLPRSEERWQLTFPGCTGFKLQTVGAPKIWPKSAGR